MSRRGGPRGGSSPDDKVGKYRPPRDKQWKPGQSGNPRGRRKGSKNRKTIVRAAERKLITVNKAGHPRKMTLTEIGLEHLQKEVASGNRKAFLDYLNILERYSDRDEVSASMQELLAEDASIMANLLARKKRKKSSNGEK